MYVSRCVAPGRGERPATLISASATSDEALTIHMFRNALRFANSSPGPDSSTKTHWWSSRFGGLVGVPTNASMRAWSVTVVNCQAKSSFAFAPCTTGFGSRTSAPVGIVIHEPALGEATDPQLAIRKLALSAWAPMVAPVLFSGRAKKSFVG